MKHIIITIDGPAASGKGTIAKYIKKNFSFYHIDSGLFYRNLAKIILDNNIKINNSKALGLLLKSNTNFFPYSSSKLKASNIATMSSKIAKIKKVRNFITRHQQKIVKKNINKYRGFVIDGRDIGSVVFKNAQIKLYIKAKHKIRSKRRHKELIDRGEKSIYSNVLKEVKLRDKRDKNRKNSPLIVPKDAIVIDNSGPLLKTKKLIKQLIIKELSKQV